MQALVSCSQMLSDHLGGRMMFQHGGTFYLRKHYSIVMMSVFCLITNTNRIWLIRSVGIRRRVPLCHPSP
jgi:hypothetical protein